MVLYARIFDPELTGGADQHLPGSPGLGVEGDRIGGSGMRALQISQLDQLMPQKSRIAVGNQQVAFSRLHAGFR